MRLVPDIAVDADPATGFVEGTTDPTYLKKYGQSGMIGLQSGGTSLASPVSAGLFTNMLMGYDVAHGIGDIHSTLYSAEATSGTFRDVTSGENGPPNGSDQATTGYDMVTGLGSPLWPAIGRVLFAGTHPVAHDSAYLIGLHARTKKRTVKITWSGSGQRATAAGAASASVTVTRAGAGTVLHLTSTTPSGSRTFTGIPGSTYQVTTTVKQAVTDVASAPVSATVRVPLDDRAFKLTKRWKRERSSGAVGGYYAQSKKAGSTATVRSTGRSYTLVVRVGPKLGLVAVSVGGVHVATLNLHAARLGFRAVKIYGTSSTPLRTRTIGVRALGKKPIGIDAIYAIR